MTCGITPTAGASTRPTGATGSASHGAPSASSGAAAGAGAGKTVTFLYDGARPSSEPDEAVIDLPDFAQDACPTGRSQFHSGLSPTPGTDPVVHFGAAINAVVVADVNGDKVPEHVALITCKGGTDVAGYAAQVVALTDAPDGSFTTLGKVYGVSGGAAFLVQTQVSADGTVKVLAETLAVDPHPASRQWHNFKWNGTTFAATGTSAATIQTGTTKLTLTVKTPTVKLQGDTATGLQAQVSYTITNKGGATSNHLEITLSTGLPPAVTVPGSLGPLSRDDAASGGHSRLFAIAPIAVYATVSGTMVLTLDPAAAATAPRSASVQFAVDGIDIDLGRLNATATNKATLTVTRP